MWGCMAETMGGNRGGQFAVRLTEDGQRNWNTGFVEFIESGMKDLVPSTIRIVRCVQWFCFCYEAAVKPAKKKLL